MTRPDRPISRLRRTLTDNRLRGHGHPSEPGRIAARQAAHGNALCADRIAVPSIADIDEPPSMSRG
jgi:hypothetical protein